MPSKLLPPDHPQRRPLADEAHARPPAAVSSPAVVSFIALIDTDATAVLSALRDLAADSGITFEASKAHAIVALPQLTVKWERHGEFTTLTFVRQLGESEITSEALAELPTAFETLPEGWLASLPGCTIAAADITLLPITKVEPPLEHATRWFGAETMVGSRVLEDAAWLATDFVVRPSGRIGFVVLDIKLGRAQTARLVQRLIEIEVYRMMALLALPIAREAFPHLDALGKDLAAITATTAMLQEQGNTTEKQNRERALLDRLTRVAAEVERSVSASTYRFTAAEAYWEIVRSRVAELGEKRIGDMRRITGFIERRVAPGMQFCAATARRQEQLSARIERASALLRTRVDVAREEQNQRLLFAMERRGKLSLRMQQTVEGLSVAAITYYAAGLVSYLSKPLKSLWPDLNPDWVVAVSIPVIAFIVWRAVESVRHGLMKD